MSAIAHPVFEPMEIIFEAPRKWSYNHFLSLTHCTQIGYGIGYGED
jgi:hypothetical protein